MTILCVEALFLEGWRDANLFTRREKANIALIKTTLQEYKKKRRPQYPDVFSSADVSANVYHRGYERGLEQALQFAGKSAESAQDRVFFNLVRDGFTQEGRLEGFRFAVDKRGHIPALQAEIAETESLINRSLAKPRTGHSIADAMQPGTSVRLHKDGYLIGLNDAISIAKTVLEIS
jgi:hypothetical protein